MSTTCYSYRDDWPSAAGSATLRAYLSAAQQCLLLSLKALPLCYLMVYHLETARLEEGVPITRRQWLQNGILWLHCDRCLPPHFIRQANSLCGRESSSRLSATAASAGRKQRSDQ